MSAYEILNNEDYLDIAASGIRFFEHELPQIQVDSNSCYFVYHPNNLKFIPNLPSRISGTMAHFYSVTSDKTILPTIVNNLRYVVNWQRDNGSWHYSPEHNYSDNFHTGFILEALAKFEYYLQDDQFNSVFLKGLFFYKNNFFSKNGCPNHKIVTGIPSNADALFTQIDVRDCAQALVLFGFLSHQDRYQSDIAIDIANWSIDHFRSKKGFFYYQELPMYKIKSPFISMQAWMLLGLCSLLRTIKKKQDKNNVLFQASCFI